ncbi:MAG: hypothetical protein A3G23_13830 [Bacteroidetes bacterium RIFCSPLOWO2_12_FULL_37_12]|nr:MAG: hypothetical protein A3G23_13830 [Bacteroidetes bacterium RIFCSPLOWO2_12_FULL_37_12]
MKLVFRSTLFPLFAFLYTIFSDTFAEQYNFKTFSLEEGMSQSTIYTICQDKRGYIWFGTLGGGVSRFDGSEFTHFSVEDGLAGNQVYKIIEDQLGNLWFGTRNEGVSVYDGKKFRTLNTKNGLKAGTIRDMIQDEKGRILLGTEGGGVHLLNLAQGLDKIEIEIINTTSGLISNAVYSLCKDNYGNIWVGTQNGISILKNSTGKIINLDEKNGLSNLKIRSIETDNSGNIWIGTFGGSVFFADNLSINLNQTYRFLKPFSVLNDMQIMDIFINNEGSIWMATLGQGVFKYKNLKLINYTAAEGLSNNNVMTVFQDKSSSMWFGTFGGGASKLGDLAFSYISTKDGLTDNHVRSMIQTNNGDLWLGTFEGGVNLIRENQLINYSTKNGLSFNRVFAIMEDKNKNIWFGTDGEGVCKFDGKKFENYSVKNGLCHNQVWTIIQDKKGIIWFGTYGNGISGFDGKEFKSYNKSSGLIHNSVLTLLEDNKGTIWIGTYEGISKMVRNQYSASFISITTREGLSNNQVISLVQDPSGNIWAGTSGGGVCKLKESADGSIDIRCYSKKDGINSNNIKSLLLDNEGNIWIGSEKGIERIEISNDGKIKKLKFFGKEEGFNGIECYQNSACKDASGNLWFGTVKGAIKYTASEVKFNKVSPQTHITNIKLFFEDVNWINRTLGTDTIPLDESINYEKISEWNALPVNPVFPYSQNHFTFSFTGISHKTPEKVRYKFKLENFDKDWLPVTKENTATYANIQPGSYIFKVLSCNEENIWNTAPAEFYFTITPPFWRTWWFYTVMAGSVLSVIAGTIKIRERNLKHQKQLLENKVIERTEELKITNDKLISTNSELEKLSIVASETDNAVIIADAQGVIEWANQAFTRMTGFSIDEYKKLKGQSLEEVSSNPEIRNIISESIEQKKSVIYESLVRHKNGEEYVIQSTLTPVLNEHRAILKLVVIDTDITERKKTEIEIKDKNRKIAQSINYAKRIQDTIIPDSNALKYFFSDSFVFLKSRDVVSGDLPWIYINEEDIYIASIDCTGHGVPGAIMSIVAHFLLDKIMSEHSGLATTYILNELHKGVKKTLQQEKNTDSHDGMDMALINVKLKDREKNNFELCFSGARRPLFHLHGNEIFEIKGDRFPIGGVQYSGKGKEVAFTENKINISRGDAIFLCSDGIIDQFGQKENKRFGVTRLSETIVNNHSLPMAEIGNRIKKQFEEWKGENKQLDDVLLIGIRF